MSWFETLMGFAEESPAQVRRQVAVEGEWLVSTANGRRYRCGRLETPSLAELRERTGRLRAGRPVQVEIDEVVADVRELHRDSGTASSLFQVASQFNLLEMAWPSITPSEGVGRYEHDRTQGPACAIAAGAGTIYRNYFVPLAGAVGQTEGVQIDCVEDLGRALGNGDGSLWTMRNGYVFATADGLAAIESRLRALDADAIDALRGLLRIGVQWDAQVTLEGCHHTVNQAYCSAMPIAYNAHDFERWEGLARLVLEASYEAVFHSAVLNHARRGARTLYLTLIGGGAFGNPRDWILVAMERAASLPWEAPLEVRIVSHRGTDPFVRDWIEARRAAASAA